ncbi:hypothetical protein FRC20_005368 [Serendipita sp. 405]|nr:hypothetical protein FRC15_005323 [Serendipita sp. 397]KAG8840895.1 hypothetical protein FRC20_005368 [Serendipita sp. 405]
MVIEWICPTVFSAAILLLTIGKLYQKASAGVALYDSELVVVLYRDGLCHYVLILCLLTWTVICWTVLPMTYMLTGFYILWAVLAVAITRLQVNLIKASVPQRINEQEDGGDYSHRMNTIRPFRGDHQQYAQPTSAPTFDVIVISREFV